MVTRFLPLLLLSFVVFACFGGDDDADPAATPRATVVSTPRPGSTPLPHETTQPSTSTEAAGPRVQLQGVFRPPQETLPTNVVELPERPRSDFAAWDGVSVVIYDTETGEAHDFGAGSLAQPAFSSEYMVYTSSENRVFLVDLQTMEEQEVATGLLAYFLGDEYIVVNPGNNNFFGLSVETGKRVDLESIREPVLASMVDQRWGGGFLAKWQDERFSIHLEENPQALCKDAGAEQRACLAAASSRWVVEDVWAQNTVLAFEANRVEPAGPTEVVMATTPVCYEAGWITDCHDVLARLEAQSAGSGSPVAVEGTSNIFLVDLRTGDATFVATATYNALTGRWPMNWPLAADERYVAWTESYCGEPKGVTHIYDRESGEITSLNRGDWLVLSEGRLGLGEQGATTILDIETLEYVALLPELSGVSWSPDLRYAAVGQGLSRGSLCETGDSR